MCIYIKIYIFFFRVVYYYVKGVFFYVFIMWKNVEECIMRKKGQVFSCYIFDQIRMFKLVRKFYFGFEFKFIFRFRFISNYVSVFIFICCGFLWEYQIRWSLEEKKWDNLGIKFYFKLLR